MTPKGLRTALNASGSAPIYACRAWVNFNGTGTVAIRASGNVTSITDNGTGDYTVNFTTALEDANYAIAGSCRRASVDNNANATVTLSGFSVQTVSSFRVFTASSNAGGYQVFDPDIVSLIVQR